MIKKTIKYILYSLLLAFIILLFTLFLPRSYDVPPRQERASTQYWDLATGSRIAYTLLPAQGPKKPFPIIYLHGGPGGPLSNSHIKSLSPLSQDGYDIYWYDQIGGGHSARLENIEGYTTERHVRDLEEIVKTIGAEQVILIGQSWGAMLATLFVTAHPEQVSKLILTGPGPILPIQAQLVSLTAPDSLQLKAPLFSNQQGNKKAHNLRSRFMTYLALIFGNKLASDEEADQFATFLNKELSKSTLCDPSLLGEVTGGAGFYAQIMTYKSFINVKDERAKIRTLKTPVLIMKGQCDNQSWGFTQEYLQLFSNHQFLLIPAAGHAIAAEQPHLYLEGIRQFITKKSPIEEEQSKMTD